LGVSRLQRLRNELKLDQEETLSSKMQKKRLRWFGHVESIEENQPPRRVLQCYIEGKRSRGRQATWMDNIKEDLKTKNLNIRTATDLIKRQNQMENSCANPSSA